MLPVSFDTNDLPRALQRLMADAQGGDQPAVPARRSFLKMAGIGGLALGAFPHFANAQPQPAAALKPTQQPSAFVRIAANGEVTVTINRLEFGQGVQTGLPMILAEELDADWSLVRSTSGTNDAAYHDPLFGMHLTGGSNSVKNSYPQYRELGARTKAMLMGAAAESWGVPVSSLKAENGVISGGGKSAGYGEFFFHRTGHGIGLEGHEDPYIVEGNDLPLAAGHAYSVEPGIYMEGKWGMRLEDIIVATDDGPLPMNTANHQLVSLDV